MVLVILVLLILVALGGGGYWYYQSQQALVAPPTGEQTTTAVISGGIQQPAATAGDLSTNTSSALAPAVEGSRYTEHKMVDWPGGDITGINTASISNCETRCKGFYAAMKENQPSYCWLKNNLNPASLIRIKPGDWNEGSFFSRPGVTVPTY